MNTASSDRLDLHAQECPIRRNLLDGKEMIVVPDLPLVAFRYLWEGSPRVDVITARGRSIEVPLESFSALFCLYFASKNQLDEAAKQYLDESLDILAAVTHFRPDWAELLRRHENPAYDYEFYSIVAKEFLPLSLKCLRGMAETDDTTPVMGYQMGTLLRVMFLRNWLHLGRKFPHPLQHRNFTHCARIAYMSAEAFIQLVDLMTDACEKQPNQALKA